MCGIAGYISSANDISDRVLDEMILAVRHRGPDGFGFWRDAGVGLAHARLAILDLSDSGKQPMMSQSGRFVITFNGEIYNFSELKKFLTQKGISLRGNSDTEVLVNLFDVFEFKHVLSLLRGMFAFALWDRHKMTMCLARDRIGEKPLYYFSTQRKLVFASELKSILKFPQTNFEIDRKALSYYFKYNYVPTPYCIYKSVFKLPAGSFRLFCLKEEIEQTEANSYWDLRQIRAKPRFKGSRIEAIDQVEKKLRETVRMQLCSDVPIGCFLSGGIDSSLIAALMQKESVDPVRSFTIGFRDKEYDESGSAAEVAAHLGTKHQEWILEQNDIKKLIPELPEIYDEPFADSSQLPTTLLARMTRSQVKVCLSGDGGDELFGGYNRYMWGNTLSRRISFWPLALRRILAGFLRTSTARNLDQVYQLILPLLPPRYRVAHFGNKISKLTSILASPNQLSVYDHLLSHWFHPQDLVVGGEDASLVTDFDSLSMVESMMMHDSRHYLPDDIMVKVDRATMSQSLESRAPLLDHELYELVWSIPQTVRLSPIHSKVLLREVLYKYVPQKIVDRPKQGFGVPLARWLREDLREWASDLLSPERIKRQGFLNPTIVSRYWDEHLSKKSNHEYLLWDVIVFQQWLDRWKRP